MADDMTVIAPSGELDLESTRSLGGELSQAVGDASRELVLDLSRVSFMDSTALGAILRAHTQLRRQGRPMAVVAPRDDSVNRLFEVSGVSRELRLYETREAAQEALRSRETAGQNG
jgi:anti-sigma B factor antagonist